MHLIFLDTETNGLNPFRHEMVEIAFVIADASTGKEIASYQSLIALGEEEWEKSDKGSLKVNGFSFLEVSQGKKREVVQEEIISLFISHKIERRRAVFICQNPSFDRAFFSKLIPTETQEKLLWPYHWLDLASMYWAVQIKEKKRPWELGISKDAIAKHYALPPEEMPHRAMNGVLHLIRCYKSTVGFLP